jgi:hypothetical protein
MQKGNKISCKNSQAKKAITNLKVGNKGNGFQFVAAFGLLCACFSEPLSHIVFLFDRKNKIFNKKITHLTLA